MVVQNHCLSILLAIVVAASLLVSSASAVDTDGDGLLDLIDAPGFDPSASGDGLFFSSGIEDLDGATLLTNLQTLFLAGNRIMSLENGDFDGLTNLLGLYLNDNLVTSIDSGDFDGLTNLLGLGLGRNQITSIEKGDFSGLTNLQGLGLESNRIMSLERDAYNGLANLQVLGLDDNQITSIESGVFDGLTNLHTLYLDDNPLMSLESGVFKGLISLRTLYLAGNQIMHLENGTFNGLDNLVTLQLIQNKISQLNFTAATLMNLGTCNGLAGGFCVDRDEITSLILDDAVLSRRSFNAIVGETTSIGEVSLVGLTFSDETPSDLNRLLKVQSLNNVTVDQALFDLYADEFNAFAATDGNTLLVVPGLCDSNRDGACNVVDIDAMTRNVLAGDNTPEERETLIHRAMPHGFGTYFGDANLDGEFNSADLVAVLAAGEYEDGIESNSGWSEGDFDGDGESTSADLVAALADGGYEQGPRATVATVPEPSSRLLCGLGIGFAYLGVRRPGLQPILRHA